MAPIQRLPYESFSPVQNPPRRFSKSRPSPISLDILSSSSCVTTFPVAAHPDEFQVSQGALAARKTWLDLMPNSDLRPHSVGPFGNFFTLCWPHGKIERVQLATEIIETLWLYDGKYRQPLRYRSLSSTESVLTSSLFSFSNRSH